MGSNISGAAQSILIVDDEPLIRMNLIDLFEDEGYLVYEAEDADSAIAILENSPAIHIVLTDIQMPGSMDGVKLAHYVRDRFPPTFLIVASGAIKPETADLPLQTMFVSKPFDHKFLLEEIARLA